MDMLITICARDGSQGLPGKNMREMNGKPLIAWTVNQAVDWNRDKDIAISTDIDEAMNLYKKNENINIVNRSKKLAEASVAKMLAIKDCVIQMEKRKKIKYKTIIDLDVCNPLRTDIDIETAYNQFKKQKPSTLISVTKSYRNPYFNMVEIDDGKVKRCKPKPEGAYRRQDVPYVYDMNNSIFIYDRDWLMADESNDPLTERTQLYVMENWQRYDIDTEVDIHIVDFIMRVRG